MKLLAALVLFTSLSAHASDTQFNVEQASFSTTSTHKVRALYLALKAMGATPDAEGRLEISNMEIHWRSNSKDFLEKSDVCYERPEYRIRFQLETTKAWLVTNDALDCSGPENAKAVALIEALKDVGFDKVDYDSAMGGQHDQNVTDLHVYPNAKDGASGRIGAPLTEDPTN